MKRVGIIGTAGRGSDGAKMSRELFESMVTRAETLLDEICGWSHNPAVCGDPFPVVAVSGGAAWADHVAVALYRRKRVAKLELHLPAGFRIVTEAGVGGRAVGFYGNKDADVANRYHAAFSRAVGGNTLRGIADALELGASAKVHAGFKARNLFVGAVDILIAFTWGPSPDVPKDGGTKHTWDHSSASRKIHVPLATLAGAGAQGALLPTGSAEAPRPVSQVTECPSCGLECCAPGTCCYGIGCGTDDVGGEVQRPDPGRGTSPRESRGETRPTSRSYRTATVELCECGDPSQSHDPWPDCERPGCGCTEWRPVR